MMNIFESTSSVLRKEVKKWLKSNQVIKKNRFRIIDRAFINFSHHPKWYAVILLVIFVIVAQLNNAPLTKNQITSINVLLQIQATILALIYPIVIGFSAILLQDTQHNKTLLRFYLIKSSAWVSGLTSVIILLILSIESVLISYNLKIHLKGLYLADCFIFYYGIILTARFLYETIFFIDIKRQYSSIRKYIINYSVKDKFKKSYWNYNPYINYIIGDANYLESKVSSRIYEENNHFTIQKNKSDDKVLKKVLFKPMKQVLSNLDIRANSENCIITHQHVGNLYNDKTGICTLINTKPNKLDIMLLRLSYRFSAPTEKDECIDLMDFMGDYVGWTRYYIEQNNYDMSVNTISFLFDLIIDIINAGNFVQDGKRINFIGRYSLTNALFSRTILESIFDSFSIIVDPSIDKIEVNSSYYKILCSSTALFVQDRLPHQLKETILDFYYFKLMNSLISWWERNSLYYDNNRNMKKLKPQSAELHYKKALLDFSGGWGDVFRRLNNYDSVINSNNRYSWNRLREELILLKTHLLYTAKMLMDAIYRDDENAAIILADRLIKWFSEIEYRISHDLTIYHMQNLITPFLFEEWHDMDKYLSDNVNYYSRLPDGYDKLKLIRALFLKRYWDDIACLLLGKIVIHIEEKINNSNNPNIGFDIFVKLLTQPRIINSGAKSSSFIDIKTNIFLL